MKNTILTIAIFSFFSSLQASEDAQKTKAQEVVESNDIYEIRKINMVHEVEVVSLSEREGEKEKTSTQKEPSSGDGS